MNIAKVIRELKEKYPGSFIIENKNDKGETTEILCEVEPSSKHPEWSLAIAVIDSSTPHLHREIVEEYKVIKGKLTLFVAGEEIKLTEGNSYTISLIEYIMHWETKHGLKQHQGQDGRSKTTSSWPNSII
jgi:mannose-6-phosphate isomerase-like protein (cupin superfamily)